MCNCEDFGEVCDECIVDKEKCNHCEEYYNKYVYCYSSLCEVCNENICEKCKDLEEIHKIFLYNSIIYE